MKPNLLPKTRKERKEWIIDRTPRVIAAHGGKIELSKLSYEVTGISSLMSRWVAFDKDGYGHEAMEVLKGKIMFTKLNPKRWMAELINKDDIASRPYPESINITQVDIEGPLNSFLAAVKAKAEQEIGQENLQLLLRIREMELEINNLKQSKEQSIVNKYFKFSDNTNEQ